MHGITLYGKRMMFLINFSAQGVESHFSIIVSMIFLYRSSSLMKLSCCLIIRRHRTLISWQQQSIRMLLFFVSRSHHTIQSTVSESLLFLAMTHLLRVLGRRASIFIPSVRIRKSPSNSIWSVVEKVNRSHATRYYCVHLCVVDCLHLCSKYVTAGNSYHFLPHPTAFHVSYTSGSSDA